MKSSKLDISSGVWSVFVAAIGALIFSANSYAGHEEDHDEMGWFVPANTPAKNFYGGVAIGYADIDYSDSNQDGSVTGISDDESDAASGFYFGYQANDYVAIQGAYRDLGESDFKGTSSGGPSWDAGSVSADLEVDGWELGVLGRWPLSDRWYALGFIGMFWWESKETFVESTGVTVQKDSGSDATYALGLEYDVGKKDRVVYRFMGARHEVDDDEYDIDSASFEVIYRFP